MEKMKSLLSIVFYGILLCITSHVSAAAPLLGQKSSTQFNYKYEANSGEPASENPGDWIPYGLSPLVNSVNSGILNCTFSQDRLWMSTETTETSLDHTIGWTYEIRLRIVSGAGSRGIMAMNVDDQPGDAGGRNGFQIHADRTQWSTDGTIADSSRNDDAFHVFRLAEEANSDIVHGWRDGAYLGSAADTGDFTQTTLKKYILFGSWSAAITGTVEIDYTRWDSTGAYAPYTPLEINVGDGLSVDEQGQTFDTYTIALKIQPSDNVTAAVTCNPEQITLGPAGSDSLELVFSPSDWGAKTIQVNAVDDDLPDGIHSSVITHVLASSDDRFNGVTDYVTVSIIDNDTVLSLADTSGKAVYEAGLTSDTYTIHCLQKPSADVQVTVSSDSDKLSFGTSAESSATLIFTPVNWASPQSVIVNATDNTGINRLRFYPVIHTITSADSRFNEYALPNVMVRVYDNDYAHTMPSGYTIPTVNMDQPHRQVIVDKEIGVYLAHPTTVLLEDGFTILAVYPRGAHGSGECVLKRSIEGGLTWGSRLGPPGRPDDWVSPGIYEVPTIHRITGPDGKRRLVIFSGLYPCRMSVSQDDGHTWTPFASVGNWGGIVTMGCVVRLKDGSYMAMFHDDGRFFAAGGSSTGIFTVYKTISSDGGLTWSFPQVVIECNWAAPCEPGVIRSPDGTQLAVLMRENSRKYNSMLITTDDEGQTWSDLKELPAALTGDRHTGQYSPDGRLFISFRDTTLVSPTKGDWVGWVGTYDDIVNLNQGQYRVRIKDNLSGGDTAYPGVEILPNGQIVTTTYGWWESGQQPYIVSSRFRLSEIDAEYNGVQYCGQPGTVYLPGDITRDCMVNIGDMVIIALNWLKCTDPADTINCGL